MQRPSSHGQGKMVVKCSSPCEKGTASQSRRVNTSWIQSCWLSGGQPMSVEGCEDVTVQYPGVREPERSTSGYNGLRPLHERLAPAVQPTTSPDKPEWQEWQECLRGICVPVNACAPTRQSCPSGRRCGRRSTVALQNAVVLPRTKQPFSFNPLDVKSRNHRLPGPAGVPSCRRRGLGHQVTGQATCAGRLQYMIH